METEGTIRLARAFCSARDRNVPVLRREHLSAPGSPEAREGKATTIASAAAVATPDGLPELVACLDYGVRCTGWLCPLFTLPTLPPEELLAEAVEAERDRKRKDVADGRAILERALSERRASSGRERRKGPTDPRRTS